MNIHTVWPNFVNWAISVTTCPLDISKVLIGLTFNSETANNLAVKYKDWQILTIRNRKKKLAVIIPKCKVTLAVEATTHWNPFIQNLHLHI